MWNVTTSTVTTYTTTWITTTLTFVKNATYTRTKKTIYVNDLTYNLSYIIDEDGKSYLNDTTAAYVTDGGFDGLREFLKVYYYLEGTAKGTVLNFPTINLTLHYNKNPFYANTTAGEQICTSSSQTGLDFCIYRWLIVNFKFFVTDSATSDYWIYTASNNVTYRVYTFGLVTLNDDSLTYVTVGGLSGLTTYLTTKKITITTTTSY
jgi:hypothetical protein